MKTIYELELLNKTMKTISIGDIHGRDKWKVVDPLKYDKIIFVGDYVDSFDVTDEQILCNLFDIIQFKKDNPDKVILLWGNHDLQYLFSYDKHGCSGYRPQMYAGLHAVFNDNKDLFRVSYQIDNTIWTHAGIHDGWFKQRFTPQAKRLFKGEDSFDLTDQLNIAFENNLSSLFDVGHLRGGLNQVGGIFWSDKRELSDKPLRGYNQIIGHTRVKDIVTVIKNNKEIVFIDTLEGETPTFFEKSF